MKILKTYILIHLDEKWFSDFIYKKFTNISLKKNDFFLFYKKSFFSKEVLCEFDNYNWFNRFALHYRNI